MRILVTANDAGGAEMLAAMVVAERASYRWCLICRDDAPARRVYERCGLEQDLVVYRDTWPDLPHACDVALCNVGWRDVKDGMVDWLRGTVPRNIGVLDNWVNYRERFGYPDPGWTDRLPHWMAACDGAAWSRARSLGFPRVARLRHYLLAGQLAAWRRMGNPGPGTDLLWLSQIVQPRGGGALAGSPYQRYETAERNMLAQVMLRWPDVSARFGCSRLVIRRHPSAPAGLYEELGSDAQAPVHVEPPGTDLLTSLVSSGTVLGFTSAALVTAWIVGRPAYSLVPEGPAGPLPLPACRFAPDVAGLLAETPDDGASATLDLFPDHSLQALWEQTEWS